MQVQKTQLTDTRIKLTLVADQALLDEVHAQVLQHLSRDVKLQGFRKGKAPMSIIEKQLNPATLQSEFIDTAINRMYVQALTDEKIRPVVQPEVNVKKFVPFTTLEFEAEVEAIGAIKLPDYKTIKLEKKPVKVLAKDVDAVIDNLRARVAEKQSVKRAAKEGDEVVIDFAGRDAETDEPIQGGEGTDYPLVLGSNTFIPGFESNLEGAKPGEEREFTLEFPADYGVAALQSKKVTFKTTVKEVNEVVLPKLDEDFVKQVGPFKTVAELKEDIKKQVTAQREQEASQEYESDLLATIADKATVAIPAALIDEELERLERDERQNVMYRGQTWQEHLDAEGVTDEEHRAKNRPGAEARVKAGLVLADIAEQEKIDVSADEINIRLQLLKGQYQDPAMQAELDKPENRREIASRILSEKTIAKLVGYATAK